MDGLLDRLNFLEIPGFGDYAQEELELLANLLVLNVDNVRERFSPMAPEHGYLVYKDKVDLAIKKIYSLFFAFSLFFIVARFHPSAV